MKKNFLKTNAAAKYLGVSRSSLTNWVKQGLLGSGVTPGGHYRFTIDELDKFAKERGLDIPRLINEKEEIKIKILAIEDDEAFREFTKEALSVFTGYEYREACDGVQGALSAGSWQPDLIILDIRMPNMNGIEFLKMLRDDPKTSMVNVIVASAHLTPELRTQLNELGVDIILEKPVRLEKLMVSVEKLTDLTIA